MQSKSHEGGVSAFCIHLLPQWLFLVPVLRIFRGSPAGGGRGIHLLARRSTPLREAQAGPERADITELLATN